MTPLDNFDGIYLKREDQNPTGSAKDRAIQAQISDLLSTGMTTAVISSSGNAAISAQYYCHHFQLKLQIFVSPHTTPSKLKLLSNFQTTSQPISQAFKYAKTTPAYNLRQSLSPIAISAYSIIGEELLIQLPKITSVFIPVGSGTTLLGVSQQLPPSVKIYAVQPAAHCPIASVFDHDYITETETITDSLSVKSLPLKNQVITAIKKSGGQGIIVANHETIKYHQTLLQNNYSLSAESGLALAGYYQARDRFDVGNFPVILTTGTIRL